MGSARWDPAAWAAYTKNIKSKSRASIFRSARVPNDLNPRFFKTRESRDSALNPQSNAIIAAIDVTGSMGLLAELLVRQGIGTTFEEILQRAARNDGTMIADPHLMVMGIGDVNCDRGPVQATQFEADMSLTRQTETIWLEGGGGGNMTESYDAAWYLAAMRTSTDCFEKRGRKGYLFTVGDEEAPTGLSKAAIAQFFGDDVEDDLTPQQLLAMAQRSYNVFHIIIEEGNYASSMLGSVQQTWRDLLGSNVLSLSDATKLAETMISAIQVNEGLDVASVAKTWSGETATVVARAVGTMVATRAKSNTGLVRFASR